MSKQLLYPAGYMVSITTWENDGDNYNTVSIGGLSEKQTKILVEVCKKFKSRHSSSDGIGNMYEPRESEINDAAEKLLNLLSSLGCVVDKEDKDYKEDRWNYVENLFYEQTGHEFYDLGLKHGEFFTRVLDNISVSFIEKEIYVENANKKFGV